MNIDKRWLFLLAVAASAAAGAALALTLRRTYHRTAHDVEQATQLKAWENEGGNLAPPAAAAELP